MNVKVSVILPSLNVADYIKECLESVIAQTLWEIEIICVDAGSTDGTFEILQQYAGKDTRVQIFGCEKKSYGRQGNEGIRRANGKYIAVVETDDFVAEEMFGKLYETAEKYSLDYVKADYDSFEELQQGGRVWQTRKTFPVRTDLYGKVIRPLDYVCVVEGDYNIWKGIYRKDFLVQKGIVLNETPGAAFQDIGFILQTICLAERALYTDDSFYRYRVKRKGASTYQPSAVKYLYQEFSRLLEDSTLPLGTDRQVWNRIYYKLALNFRVEYEKVLRMEQYNTDSEHLSKYYEWFCGKILYALKKELLNLSDFGGYRMELELLLKSGRSYADYKYVRDKMETEPLERLREKIGERRVIIFGCGRYGKEICAILDIHGLDVAAFCDNNQTLWGKSCYKIEVMSPEICCREYEDAFFIAACRQGGEDMKRQLEGYGIHRDSIAVWPEDFRQ